MLLDPSGASRDVAGVLPLLPLSSLLLPALFLLVVLGLTPPVLAWDLLSQPEWAGLARWLGEKRPLLSLERHLSPQSDAGRLAGDSRVAHWVSGAELIYNCPLPIPENVPANWGETLLQRAGRFSGGGMTSRT